MPAAYHVRVETGTVRGGVEALLTGRPNGARRPTLPPVIERTLAFPGSVLEIRGRTPVPGGIPFARRTRSPWRCPFRRVQTPPLHRASRGRPDLLSASDYLLP